MVTPSDLKLLLFFSTIAFATHAQDAPSPSLNIGDPAPLLHIHEWIKGAPVKAFEKDKVYVLEYWATWCSPCRAAMPRLSALAREYRDRVTILGIDLYGMESRSMEKVKAFVDSMGLQMDYKVAAQDSNMVAAWMAASGEQGVPSTFVVNKEGRIAWIGHPKDLEKVLPEIVNDTWNINEALAKRNSDRRLDELDTETSIDLMGYVRDLTKPDAPEKTDSILFAIDEIVRKEPKLKYAPSIAFRTFASLLQTNPHKAYEYGKMAIVTPTYEEPACSAIIAAITVYAEKLDLPAEIYQLGAEACQGEIDQFPYPELIDIAKRYNQMAAWYWRADDASKAISAQQKAIEALKTKKGFSAIKMTALKSRLQQYKNSVAYQLP